MEKITIIIPVYNAEKTLHRCLDGVKNQTYKNIEAIVIDDSSTDNSLEIAREFAKGDERFKVIAAEHQGQGLIRNIGLDMANGSYIGFVDSDDTIHKEMFETMYSKLRETNADIAQCNILNIYNGNQTKTQIPLVDETIEILDRPEYFRKYIFKSIHSYECCNKLYRKEILEGIRFEDNKKIYAEDLLFNLEVALKIRSIAHISKPLYYYYQSQDSHSKKTDREKLLSFCNLFNLFLNKVDDEALRIEVKRLAVLIIMLNLSRIIRTPEGKQTAKEILTRKDIRNYMLSYAKSNSKVLQRIVMLCLLYLPMGLKNFVIEVYYLNM